MMTIEEIKGMFALEVLEQFDNCNYEKLQNLVLKGRDAKFWKGKTRPDDYKKKISDSMKKYWSRVCQNT